MSAADGERIAPVTYLFGAPKATTSEQQDAVKAPSARTRKPKTEFVLEQPFILAEAVAAATEAMAAARRDDAERAAIRKSKSKGSFDKVSNVSMYALARRGMSSREMRDYLLGREFEPAIVDEEIERLEKVALLDDHALAETLIRTLQSRKGLGRSALTAELRRRNIDQLAIESAMTVLDDDDELVRATEIAMKRAGQLHSLDATTAKRRLVDFLMRRGYSGSVVSKAVQSALTPSGPTFR